MEMEFKRKQVKRVAITRQSGENVMNLNVYTTFYFRTNISIDKQQDFKELIVSYSPLKN